ncbi:DUF3168 domain-containing protein [Sphingobium sp. 3R8]|uniref:tail completion protein gp17 n=1 Tax=Sphingobium sp. 3R8 TaxID=2874921 RepID=UPI001CCE3249|nr:DUF3168 domain-containing protein [Sphingobium sp. 3R8]MBZ9650001.1 DUF3168 domain-containing protein [Sphingobium sp. 3R8]
MDVDVAMLARFTASSPLQALIAGRAYWGERPQNVQGDCLTMQQIDNGRLYTHDGASDLNIAPFQINCWGSNYQAARALSRLVIAAIEPPATVGNVRFDQSFLTNDIPAPVEDLPGGGKVHRRILEFSIYWKE